jgi:hypothetical protein
MGNAANVQFIVQTEPWRGGQGRPRNSIDPIWANDTLVQCAATVADLEWEPGTPWWWCRKCGKCSNLSYLEHFKVETPEYYYDLSLSHFLRRRQTQGLQAAEANNQAMHIMGVVLRVAASMPPVAFEKLVDNILQLGE